MPPPPACSDELGRLIRTERDELLARWRSRVAELPSARGLDGPTLEDHIPDLLDQITDALCGGASAPSGKDGEHVSAEHGHQRFAVGFDIEEVVAEYGALRRCLYDLAELHGVPIEARSIRLFAKALDSAIAIAVRAFVDEQTTEIRRRREEYLSFVAHDLRTPLNAVALAAQVVEMEFPHLASNKNAERMLGVLQRNVRQVQSLVAKILDENTTVRSGAQLQRRPIDLWPFVETVLRDLEPSAKSAGTTLQNLVPDTTIHADADLLRRIIENLVVNAIKYAPGGKVAVGAQRRRAATEVWVTDDGAGIPRDRFDGIFEKFQTDPKQPGAGLGLSIVKNFVELHGGHVSVESKEGAGSTFRFTLPNAAQTSSATQSASSR